MTKHRLNVTTYELERLLRGIRFCVASVTSDTRAQMRRASDRVDLAEPYFDVLTQDKAIEKRLETIVANAKKKPAAKKTTKPKH